MRFNSGDFLIFFPVVTILYFVLKHRYRWLLLLTASCIFYMYFIPAYLLILFLLILIDYTAARMIASSDPNHRKLYLMVSIFSTCIALLIFKYFNFFNENFAFIATFFHCNYSIAALNLILPIGLSFHTFQSLSYVIEVYRGNQQPERKFGIYALYVMFYPQLVAGPIERPQNLLHQFYEKHEIDYDRVTSGLKQMLWGFFKKMVIADNLAMYADAVYNNPAHYHGNFQLIATWCFAIQIYCDFSGYSDIAIGAAKVMGFSLMKNFDSPYSSRSVSEFWSRWHISLSTWFRDYVYIPLGGNQVSLLKWTFNIFIVFLVSGLWHGANWTFVIWGLLHGVFVITEKYSFALRNKVKRITGLQHLSGLNSFLSVVITFNLVSFAWIFFRAKNLSTALEIVKSLQFNPETFAMDFQTVWHQLAAQELHPVFPVFLIILLVIFAVAEWLIKSKRIQLIENIFPKAIRWTLYYAMIAAIVLFGVYEAAPTFIYFQF
ncbi:MAG: MBOAT family protein [Chitinophagaceae bacterium]|nr:MBOAT family protein [Chitinophagaceae bacterium]